MAASDLQKRLEYLVSYSSQLMFISSDVARQAGILDSFISQSNEQIEVALIAATTTTPLARYREQLFQQLISKTQTADFSRPLNQLLAELNHHDGPIIISITKAEDLPNKLVKELWDLVLQSRFTQNKQHLNILLFAQEPWARDTQKRLTSKSGDKPLLLNTTTSVHSLQTDMSSDLDKLIALKRKKFAERIQQRTSQSLTTPILLKRKSIIAGFILIFIALFAAILSWLYPEQLLALVVAENPPVIVSEIESPIIGELPIELDQAAAPVVLSSEAKTIDLAKDEALNDLTITSSQVIEAENIKLTDNDLLVTSWHNAINQVEIESAKFLKNKAVEVSALNLKSSNPKVIPVQEPTIMQSELKQVNDYKVSEEDETIHLPADSALITSVPQSVLKPGDYFIQISAMANQSLVLELATENNLTNDIWTYQTQRFGGTWHVLLLNKTFPNLNAAREAIAFLPAKIRTLSPFVKSATAVQQEITANLR